MVHRPSDPLEVSSQLTQSVKGELFLLCLSAGVRVDGPLGALGQEGGAAALTFALELLTRPTSYFLEAVTLAAYYGLLRTRQQAEASPALRGGLPTSARSTPTRSAPSSR